MEMDDHVSPHKLEAFNHIMNDNDPGLKAGEGFILDEIRDHANKSIH